MSQYFSFLSYFQTFENKEKSQNQVTVFREIFSETKQTNQGALPLDTIYVKETKLQDLFNLEMNTSMILVGYKIEYIHAGGGDFQN